MSEAVRQAKERLLSELQVQLEATRRRETYLASYILDLTCDIKQMEFAEAEERGELPFQRGHERAD